MRFLFVGPKLCPCWHFSAFTSGFLQIPPRDGHPCLRLAVPATESAVDFHHLVIAHAGRTAKNSRNLTVSGIHLEVTPGFEPGNQGFADPCLTTWLCHHRETSILYANFSKKSTFILDFNAHTFVWALIWSGQRGSNSLPPPWQGGALPDELCPQVVPRAGIEPATRGFSVHCSTN